MTEIRRPSRFAMHRNGMVGGIALRLYAPISCRGEDGS
jgi:hypothetical protein